MLEELNNKGLIKENEGVWVIFIQGHPIPLIVLWDSWQYQHKISDLGDFNSGDHTKAYEAHLNAEKV